MGNAHRQKLFATVTDTKWMVDAKTVYPEKKRKTRSSLSKAANLLAFEAAFEAEAAALLWEALCLFLSHFPGKAEFALYGSHSLSIQLRTACRITLPSLRQKSFTVYSKTHLIANAKDAKVQQMLYIPQMLYRATSLTSLLNIPR